MLVIDGLGDVVESAVLCRFDGITAGRICRHDDYGSVAVPLTKLFEYRQAIDVRQPDIQQNQVRLLLQRDRLRSCSIRRRQYLIPFVG